MTEAEKQVAGKTYRITKGHSVGELVSYDAAGRGPGGSQTAGSMVYLLQGDPWAEEVTPPAPEVKVGDRFEVTEATGIYVVGEVIVVKNLLSHGYVDFSHKNGRDSMGHTTSEFFLSLRRLPPEPAKPLCECGAVADGGTREMWPCLCMVEVCLPCKIDRKGSIAFHRVTKHPVATPQKACTCLSMACSYCGEKLLRDAGVAAEMLADDALNRSRQQVLTIRPLYSPAAMMGGMWPVHGRK